MLSWQNILSKRQIAADLKEKWANQGDVLRGGISPIYLSSSNKWKPCLGTIKSRPRNLREAMEKYFQFQWNCKQLRIEARNSMANSEFFFFPVFSKTIHTILKISPQLDLRKVRWRLLQQNIGCQNFWPKFLLGSPRAFKCTIHEYFTNFLWQHF